MSGSTLPQPAPLHSHATAVIGARLNLTSERGDEHAKLIWPFVLSHTKWPGVAPGPTWANNATLAGESGLDKRHVALGLATLRTVGMLTTPYGVRPGAARKFGRLLVPTLGSRCKVLVPERHDMANLWALCRERRPQPASLVTAMIGAYALASDAAGHRFDEWSPLGCSQASWRRFTGSRKNASWFARVRECESFGLIRRSGRVVEVAPPRSWNRTWRAMESLMQDAEPEPPSRFPRTLAIVSAVCVAGTHTLVAV